MRAQVALIPEGVAIRGAVTIGDIVQSWGVVYGPAVVRAYELESVKGGPPRIVIDDKALSLLQPPLDGERLADRELGLARQEGTALYLDYLNTLAKVELRSQNGDYPKFLRRFIADFIRRCLAKYGEKPEVVGK